MGYVKFLGMGYKKFLGMGYGKFLGMGYGKFLGMGYGKFLGIVSTFSPDFPVKDSWEFPRIPGKDSQEFPQIFRKIVTWVKRTFKSSNAFFVWQVPLYFTNSPVKLFRMNKRSCVMFRKSTGTSPESGNLIFYTNTHSARFLYLIL